MAISNEDQKEIWNTSKIIEELHYNLISTKGKDGLRKYEQQSGFLLYRIPIWRTPGSQNLLPPPFTIELKDISEEVKEQLVNVPINQARFIIKEAVSTLFENLGVKEKEYFNKNVRHLLKVRFI